MKKFIINPNNITSELKDLITILASEYPISFSGDGIPLYFEYDADDVNKFECRKENGKIKISYSTTAAAARGISSALADIECSESTPFKSFGIMLDVSRGMVMTVEHLKKWMNHLALAGYNMLMLYAEDVYRLENEPYFGRFRGAYSAEEIRELDDYAAKLGIELIGCIQTLGHMEQILRWRNAYGDISDTELDLLAGEEKTYILIDKMIRFWAANLRSKRIHIGMDETQKLGRGRFLTLNGYRNPFEILNRHLARVNEICKEHSLEPMIWSDMYFRFNNPEHNYYDFNNPLNPQVMEHVPANVNLVYWDYYHTEKEPYIKMIQRHREAGFAPVMASGIWTWPTLWYNHAKTMETIPPCIAACREMKIKELFFTMWGDDGAYCNYDSSLFGIIKAAELAFGTEDEDNFAKRFAAICKAEFAPVSAAAEFGKLGLNPALVFWDDPLMGIYYDEKVLRDGEESVAAVISKCHEIIDNIKDYKEEKNGGDITHLINILDLLIKKLEFRRDFEKAYFSNDRAMLQDIADRRIADIITALKKFDRSFREQYLECSKPFGLDRIQLRNGGLISRLEETASRIKEYLCGKYENIAELEEPSVGNINTISSTYAAISTGSVNRW